MIPHLWEVDHSYYCNNSNYFSSDGLHTHKSWEAFLGEMGAADNDLNMIFRWDWHEGEGYDLPNFNGDPYYRNGQLCLYYMLQRKGIFKIHHVEVCRADEPEIIKFLQDKFNHLFRLWQPFNIAEDLMR